MHETSRALQAMTCDTLAAHANLPGPHDLRNYLQDRRRCLGNVVLAGRTLATVTDHI